MTQLRIAALAIVAGLFLASCKPEAPPPGPVNPGTTAQPPVNGGARLTRSGATPSPSDTLIRDYKNDPDRVNAVLANDTVSDDFNRWVYETLAERTFEDPDVYENVLAESHTFDEKTLEYTINLRKGVMWHPMKLPDGTPLPDTEFTSADVKFTFDCILNKHTEAAAIRSYYEDPDAKEEADKIKIVVTVVDKYTIKVKWKKPYFQSKEFTLANWIIPKHVYSVDEKGEPISFDFSSKEFAEGFNKHWANDKMCGTGPMILSEWKKNERLTLVRNEKYWGKPFYFKSVVFKCIPNPNTGLQLVLQNELDWSPIPEKDHFVQNQSHEAVKSGKVKLVAYPYPVYRYMGYNLQRDLFKDRRVRRALSHAVPVDQIIEKIYHGLATRTSGPFLVGGRAHDASIAPIPFDLEAAKKLLDEAGWKDSDGDGVRDMTISNKKVDARFDLMIYADSPQYKTIAEIVKENMRQVGVDVIISPAKWALMLEKLRKKEFDVCILGWALGWQQDPFQIWHGSQADVPDSSNSIGYKNPEVDKLIDELRVTLDEAKQLPIYHKIHRIIYEDQPYTFLFVDKQTAAHHARLEHVDFYRIRPCIDCRVWSAKAARN
jgi:ABC-type transport system substrate-binding protein